MNTDTSKDGSEEPLKSAARSVNALAEQIEQTVNRGKARLSEMQTALVDKTKVVAKTTDEYVHENPWVAIGAAAGIGFILGLLIRRR